MSESSSLSFRTFDFSTHAVRVLEQSGEPWFVAADVCRVLEISNPRDAVISLDDDEKATVGNPDARPGQPGAKVFNIVSESGLYALIFKSRKPQAKAFRKWVTAEVLPEIRRTGAYAGPVAQGMESDDAAASRARVRDEVEVELREIGSTASHALMGVLSGRLRLSQGKVVASLVGHRLALLRLRLDLWAVPGGAAVVPAAGAETLAVEAGAPGVSDRDRAEMAALVAGIWDTEGAVTDFETWRGLAMARGLFPWVLGDLSQAGQRSALGKLLRRWENQWLGNGLAFRVVPGRRVRRVEIYRWRVSANQAAA